MLKFICSREKKQHFIYLKENISRKSECCWTCSDQRTKNTGQAQRTAWATRERSREEAKHWSQLPASQSRTTNLPSLFTRHLPRFILGQRSRAVGCKPWGQEDSIALCFWHPPVWKALVGASISPAVTGVPFDTLTPWDEAVTPPHSQGGLPFWGHLLPPEHRLRGQHCFQPTAGETRVWKTWREINTSGGP